MINSNVFGFHSSFYYCGLEHLIVNMYQYIKDGVDKREKICICTDNIIYLELLKHLGAYSKYMECFDAVEMMDYYKRTGLSQTKVKLSKYIAQNIKKGYTGLRFIMQIDYVISKTCSKDFLCFDENISDMILGTRASFMCIYDFEDYLNNKNFINDNVLRKSYKNHFFRLYKGELKKWNKLLNLK
ncbi:MEDS domain-containing protein [Clostridium sp. JNZ X4-2]